MLCTGHVQRIKDGTPVQLGWQRGRQRDQRAGFSSAAGAMLEASGPQGDQISGESSLKWLPNSRTSLHGLQAGGDPAQGPRATLVGRSAWSWLWCLRMGLRVC